MTKVSLITPCFNAEKYIGKTIASVQAQTLTDWELIVVDDGSRDRSAAIVQTYMATDPRIQLIQQPNGGVCRARNVGFAASSKESSCLLFLDADDCLKPEMLTTLTAYLDQRAEVGVVYCDYTYINSNDETIETPYFARYMPTRLWLRVLPSTHPDTPFISIFARGAIPSVSMIRRSSYEQTSGWDEAIGQIFEDTDLLLNLALQSQCHYFPQSLVYYRKHSEQATARNNYGGQEAKLYHKWTTSDHLTDEQKALFQAAYRFCHGRATPRKGLQLGSRSLKQGDLQTALRYYLGALRRYAGSFLPQQQS